MKKKLKYNEIVIGHMTHTHIYTMYMHVSICESKNYILYSLYCIPKLNNSEFIYLVFIKILSRIPVDICFSLAGAKKNFLSFLLATLREKIFKCFNLRTKFKVYVHTYIHTYT